MNLPTLILRLILGKRLPVTSGELHIPGAVKPIQIHRDRYGIPTIQAESETDAHYGLGFCQGQDRAFQLEMLLRVNHGTLSEIVGEGALPVDRLARRLGFHRYAQDHYALLGADSREKLDAFARGVSEGALYGCRKVPHEFAILRAKPTPWSGVDVLAGGNYIAFGLSPWAAKLTRLILLQADGPEAIQALDHDYADWLTLTRPVKGLAGEAIDRLAQDLEKLTGVLGLNGASNNWCMQASRTATGRPILANDPHLWPAIPTQWYLAHLEAPGLKVAGAAFLGAPNFPSGHNQAAAWGVTASLADQIDLYIEELGEDKKSVRNGEGFAPCKRIPQVYQIKGKDPFEEDILITPRGPIISDVMEVDFGFQGDRAIAMRATWMHPQQLDGLLDLHHASDFESFREATSKSRIVSQNFVYADTDDNIGWQYTSDVPQRSDAWGVVPLLGWDARFAWESHTTPWEQMPYLHNPEAGFIATANNKPVDDEQGIYLGRDWIEYRHTRIVDLLAERVGWDLDATQQMQLDRFNIPWVLMKPLVLDTPVNTKSARLALDILNNWDGVLSADSRGGAVYEFFVVGMLQRMAKSKAPNAAKYALDKGFHPLVERSFFTPRAVSNLIRQMRSQPEGWFENGWAAEIEAALAEAIELLETRLGPDTESWSWGAVHHLVLSHPLGIRPPLDKIFNRGPYPTGGDYDTIAQAGRRIVEFGSNITGLANLRAVHDVGNWNESRFVLAGGQSGNPCSPHYDDLLQLWLKGEMVSIAWSEEAVAASTQKTLNLIPKKSTP